MESEYHTAEEILSENRAWIIGTARRITFDPDRVDDVAQEGNIALWRAFQELSGVTEPERTEWSRNRAKIRMRHIADTNRREREVGHEPLRGHVDVKPVTSLDKPVELSSGGGSPVTLGDLLPGPDPLLGLEIAYHHGEISRVINSLEPEHREYVVLRFWGGLTSTEAARETGMSTSGAHNRWVRTIRPRLAEGLAHLEAS